MSWSAGIAERRIGLGKILAMLPRLPRNPDNKRYSHAIVRTLVFEEHRERAKPSKKAEKVISHEESSMRRNVR